MKKIFCSILFFLAHSYLFSYEPKPWHLDFYSGYRIDEFECSIFSKADEQVLIYSEKFENPKYIQTGTSFTVLNNGFYLFADIGYAALLTDKMKMMNSDQDRADYYFDYKVRGYDLNGAMEIGITANLSPERLYKLYVIPFVGYNGFWKFYKSDCQTDQYSEISNGIRSEGYSLSGHRKFREVWYGPYVGGKLYIEPNHLMNFDLSYHFNWLKLKLKFKSLLEVLKYSEEGDLFLQEFICKDFNDTLSDGYSHQALAKVTFNTSDHVKVGFFARYDYIMCNKKEGNLEIDITNIIPENRSNKYNSPSRVFSRWWNLTGAFELIFQF